MGRLNLQVRYWKMVHHGIKLAMEELEKMKKEEEAKEQPDDKKIQDIRDDLWRYEEIEKLVMKAEKRESLLASYLGPDIPPDPIPEPSEDDEMKWRNLMQLD